MMLSVLEKFIRSPQHDVRSMSPQGRGAPATSRVELDVHPHGWHRWRPYPVFPSVPEGAAPQVTLHGTDMLHPHESEPTKTAWIVDESDPRHDDVIVQTIRSVDENR